MIKCATLLITPVTVVGFSVLATAQHVERVTVPLPATWVPFTAEIVRRDTTGQSYGLIYRRGDGSVAVVRESSYRSAAIEIVNRQIKRKYMWAGAGPWISWELILDDEPPPSEISVPAQLPERHEDFDVYQVGTPDEGMALVAPALNGYAVLARFRFGAYVTEDLLRNIRIGEPAGEVFLPPPGVSIQKY